MRAEQVLRDPPRVEAVRRTGLLGSAQEAGFDRLTRLAATLLEAPFSACVLVDSDQAYFKSLFGAPGLGRDARPGPLLTQVLSSPRPVVIDDLEGTPLAGDPLADELSLRAWVAAPLIVRGGQTIGLLCVGDGEPRQWSDAEVRLAEDLAAAAVTEIELGTMAREAEAAHREAENLYRLMQAVTRAQTPAAVYEAALDALQRSLGVPRAAILLIDPDGVMRFKAWRGLSDGYRAEVEGHTPWTQDGPEPTPLLVRDVAADPAWSAHHDTFRRESIAALGFIPLLFRARLLGKFMVYHARPHAFTEREVRLAQSIAGHVAFAVHAHQRQTMESGHTRALELIAAEAPLPEVLTEVAGVMEALTTDGARAAILLLDPERRTLRVGAAPSIPEPLRRALDGAPAVPESGPFAACVLAGATTAVPDLQDESLPWPGFRSLAAEYGLRSCWSAPILSSRGDVLGAFALLYAGAGGANARDLDLAGRLMKTASVAVARGRAETERTLLLEQIQQRDRLKDEFLATLAHELRNPLAPIRTGIELLRMGAGDPDSLESVRGIIERQSSHLVRLVDDLLDVSRISRGKVELRREPVDAGALLARAVDELRGPAEARRLRLELHLPRRPLPLVADPVRLVQVLTNVIGNAVKYTDPGGVVEARADMQGGQVTFSVRDTGIGIAADLLPRIFEPFVQAERSTARSHGGLGLGLALVRSLVLMHGGIVEATSAGPGEGSEFVIRLPAGAPDAAADAVPARPVSGLRSGAAAHRRRVLVVDDNLDAAESLATFLAAYGHTVRVAHDGQGALDEAQRYRPEVVLLDIGLPHMDGYEVARRMRAEPTTARATILALTGYGQETDRLRSREAGIDDHLVKPVDPLALRALLERDS